MMGRVQRLLVCLLMSGLFLFVSGEWAEGQTTPDMLQTFQGLTAEQQQTIRSALGAATGTQSSGTYGPSGVGQRPTDGASDAERMQRQLLERRLRAAPRKRRTRTRHSSQS